MHEEVRIGASRELNLPFRAELPRRGYYWWRTIDPLLVDLLAIATSVSDDLPAQSSGHHLNQLCESPALPSFKYLPRSPFEEHLDDDEQSALANTIAAAESVRILWTYFPIAPPPRTDWSADRRWHTCCFGFTSAATSSRALSRFSHTCLRVRTYLYVHLLRAKAYNA